MLNFAEALTHIASLLRHHSSGPHNEMTDRMLNFVLQDNLPPEEEALPRFLDHALTILHSHECGAGMTCPTLDSMLNGLSVPFAVYLLRTRSLYDHDDPRSPFCYEFSEPEPPPFDRHSMLSGPEMARCKIRIFDGCFSFARLAVASEVILLDGAPNLSRMQDVTLSVSRALQLTDCTPRIADPSNARVAVDLVVSSFPELSYLRATDRCYLPMGDTMEGIDRLASYGYTRLARLLIFWAVLPCPLPDLDDLFPNLLD